jgi:hypothetical protein
MKTIHPSHASSFEVYSFTGMVEESGKNMETKVYGGGGGGATYQGTGGSAPVTISSRTVVHDQFFLVNAEGREQAFQLQDFNLAARKSNILTVFWGIKSGRESGNYFAIKNHSTNQEFYRDDLLKSYFIKGWLQGVLLVAAVLLLGVGFLGGAGILYTIAGGAAGFWAWKRWDTAKKEINDFKNQVSGFQSS